MYCVYNIPPLFFVLFVLRSYKLSLSRSLSLSLMRPAAALVYLASVARVAAIQYTDTCRRRDSPPADRPQWGETATPVM